MLGAGRRCGCCELAVHVVEACWVLGAGAGAGAVSWLCVRWRQVAGVGAACRRWCCELAVHKVEAGCWCWCRALVLVVLVVCVVQIGCWCRVLALAVRVMETRHAVLHVKIGVAANAGCSPDVFLRAFAI